MNTPLNRLFGLTGFDISVNDNNAKTLKFKKTSIISFYYHKRDSVTTMIGHLEWSSLEQRRKRASLLMLYKIHHGLIAINPDNYLFAMPPSATRFYHPSKFQLIPARIQIYKNSFFPRTVTWWNSLPDNILTSPTI